MVKLLEYHLLSNLKLNPCMSEVTHAAWVMELTWASTSNLNYVKHHLSACLLRASLSFDLRRLLKIISLEGPIFSNMMQLNRQLLGLTQLSRDLHMYQLILSGLEEVFNCINHWIVSWERLPGYCQIARHN
jgi:hypothetical protein